MKRKNAREEKEITTPMTLPPTDEATLNNVAAGDLLAVSFNVEAGFPETSSGGATSTGQVASLLYCFEAREHILSHVLRVSLLSLLVGLNVWVRW